MTEKRQTKCWHNGNGTGEEDTFPACPLQIQETLHCELASVGAWEKNQEGGYSREKIYSGASQLTEN